MKIFHIGKNDYYLLPKQYLHTVNAHYNDFLARNFIPVMPPGK